MNLGGWEIVIILGVLVLLFGAKKLPIMARSIGQSARVLKGEMKGLREDDKVEEPVAPQPKAQPVPPVELPPPPPAPKAEAPAPEPGVRSTGQ